MRRLPLFVLPLVLSLVSCIQHESAVHSSDCTASIQAQFTRIFIGIPSAGGRQTGTSALDPLDGSTAEKFDTILRTIAEGQRPTWGTQSQIPPENLIVCVGAAYFIPMGNMTGLLEPVIRRTRATSDSPWRKTGTFTGRARTGPSSSSTAS